MRYWVGGFIVFVLALLQASSVEQFKIVGVAPNLMLVLLVAWLVVRGLDDVLPMIAVAGITLGLVGLQTPGLVLLGLLPIAGLGLLRELHVIHSDALLTLALVLAASLAYETIMLLHVMATGGVLDLTTAFTRAVLPAAIVNVMLTPPIYLVMRFAKPNATRRRLSY
jgi:cell shape-determining protein MreD